MRLLLASQSATRRAMLQAAGITFEAIRADLDEDREKNRLRASGAEAAGLAAGLADMKALAVEAGPGDLVIGSDQTLELDDGTMLDKPRSRADAAAQLRRLSGSPHRLHSAATCVEDRVPIWRQSECATLTMRPLTEAFIESYLDQEYEAVRFSVGGYRVEGLGAQLFERIDGSHFAILGLPLLPLLAFLRGKGFLAS